MENAQTQGHSFLLSHPYGELSDELYATATPERFPQPELICMNAPLAKELGLDLGSASNAEWAEYFSGQKFLNGSKPIALAYAGHQFGYFNPLLGDGRAVLLGTVSTAEGQSYDLQLKGSGKTPFASRGDGKSSLGPVLREYIVSEAMHALGIPTTRALAAVRTGERVYRHRAHPGGVFTRVASSHLRVGTFEFLAHRQNTEGLRQAVNWAVERHAPDLKQEGDLAFQLFQRVVSSQIELVTQWMAIGFIHGVMNTDNMSISGETLDYGPCALMDEFQWMKTFSSIDTFGRYSYYNQGKILQWNMACFAEALLPLYSHPENILENFQNEVYSISERFQKSWLKKMRHKLGLFTPQQGDNQMVMDWLNLMEANQLDFTASFRSLSKFLTGQNRYEPFKTPSQKLQSFLDQWQARLSAEPYDEQTIAQKMNSVNPAYIPRNHLIEKAIDASENGDDAPFFALNETLQEPYRERENEDFLAQIPAEEEKVQLTFCGT